MNTTRLVTWGRKEERISATLNPRYENRSIWHYKGGNTQTLEEELMSESPPHDDIKDALMNAIEIAVFPNRRLNRGRNRNNVIYSNRFGGVAFA